MIDIIFVSKHVLRALKIELHENYHCFQWTWNRASRISCFDGEEEACPRIIGEWFHHASKNKLKPVLLLTRSEATRWLDDLPPSAKIDILPEESDRLFERASNNMQRYLYAPDPFIVDLWTDWTVLGALPPAGTTEALDDALWTAYGDGLHKWFADNRTHLHPLTARSLLFSTQSKIKIDLAEIDTATKVTQGDTVTFSPIGLPFARFRLSRPDDQYRWSVLGGPMVDEALDAPTEDVVRALIDKKEQRRIAVAERLKRWIRLPQFPQPAPHGLPLAAGLAAGLAITLIGGPWVWQSFQSPPDISDSFYDYPQPRGLSDHLPVRTVTDLEATLRQWKRFFIDSKLPYRITAESGGKVVEVWVGPQPSAALSEWLTREQLLLGTDGWVRAQVQEQEK